MKINITITDETILENVESAVSFAEWDNFIGFPGAAERQEFIEAVSDEIISKMELYGNYNPNYAETVQDMAVLQGYAL